jgi:hypothetical protein
LIERFQALELIEPSFNITQRQGVCLKQWVDVADLAVSSVTP